MTVIEGIALAQALAKVAGKIPDAIDRVSSFVAGGDRPDDVLAELPSLEANRLEQARIETLAAQAKPEP